MNVTILLISTIFIDTMHSAVCSFMSLSLCVMYIVPPRPTICERRQQYEAAADEWDALPDVHCAPPGQQRSPDGQQRPPPATPCLEFSDVWAYFKDKDLSAHMVSAGRTAAVMLCMKDGQCVSGQLITTSLTYS